MSLGCGRDKCMGGACGNFNDPKSRSFNPQMKPGCKGGFEYPPWSHGKWYNEHDFTKKVDENEDRN